MFRYLILFLTVFNLVSNVKSKELELTSLLTQIMDKNRINGILESARSVTCNYRGHDPQGLTSMKGGCQLEDEIFLGEENSISACHSSQMLLYKVCIFK